MYYIQGLYSNGYVLFESSEEDEAKAITAAQELSNDLTFEGDCVRVISIDGELVYPI